MPGNIQSTMSDPSTSVDEINIPEVTETSVEFVYNYYTPNERVNPEPLTERPLDKIPRYAFLRWKQPKLSTFELQQNNLEKTDNTGRFSIKNSPEKILSEDDSLNGSYFSYVFSNVRAIQQGVVDLEAYSRLSDSSAESMTKMAMQQVNDSVNNAQDKTKAGNLLDSYAKLSNFPQSSLGLRVVNAQGKESTDSENFVRTITKSVSLRTKVYSSVLPDIFENLIDKNQYSNLRNFQQANSSVLNAPLAGDRVLEIDPIKIDTSTVKSNYLTQPVILTGYVIDRYLTTQDGFKKQETFYIDDITTSTYVDRNILYGETYIYTIKVIASVQILTYPSTDTRPQMSTIYVSSRPVSIPVECFEYVPPPPPDGIRFTIDYKNFNLTIHWDMPTNPQRDIKQFQVFRRKTIKEPFELIAQYGFDDSVPGTGNQKYITNERVDANNYSNMSEEDRYLIKTSSYPIYSHTDEDFTVDTEFYMSSEYIYAVCSVDAHGLVSNYSSQYHVRFDSYKNRLNKKLVCSSGSPKQYPNMNLRLDTFKDLVQVTGQELKKFQVYFTPEYLRVKDAVNSKIEYKIVEAKTVADKNPYYLLQLINLDNQKLQTLKINILDMSRGITS